MPYTEPVCEVAFVLFIFAVATHADVVLRFLADVSRGL